MKEASRKIIVFSVIIEYVTTIFVMFFSYRYFVSSLGLKNIGIWALITAFFSLSSIGNSGFASSAVKFVAKYFAYNNTKKIIEVIATTFLTVSVISVILLTGIVEFIYIFHDKLFSNLDYEIIKEIILIGGVSFLISIQGRVFLSSLDGLKLIHIRGFIGFVSKIVYLFLIYFLITKYGFKGLIYAELIQYLSIFIIAGIILYIYLKPRPFHLLKFNKEIFIEMFNYGSIFQLTSIFQMLMDPLTKFFLRKFGGLESIALYDISYKFFFQARQLIVTFITTLIPYVSVIKEKEENNLAPLYLKTYKINLILSSLLLILVYALLPILFNLLNLTLNNKIIYYSIFISLTLMFNLIGVPAFIFNLGTGWLYSNFIFTFIMAISNLILCLILGPLFEAKGILCAGLLSQFLALIYLIKKFSKNSLIEINTLLNKKIIFLFIVFTMTLFLITINYLFFLKSSLLSILINSILIVPIISYSMVDNNELILIAKIKLESIKLKFIKK